MTPNLHPTLAADKWGRARALSFALDEGFEPLLVQVMGLPNLNGNGHHFHMALGALGLVKPFDWMKWDAPALTRELVPTLDDDTAWRHVTRVVRCERFCEGTFDAHIRNGSLTALLRHLYTIRCTENGRPLNFPMFSDGSVEQGLRLVGFNLGTIGHTTGRHDVCGQPECSRWSVELELSNGRRQYWCSDNWHYVHGAEELFILQSWSHRKAQRPMPTRK